VSDALVKRLCPKCGAMMVQHRMHQFDSRPAYALCHGCLSPKVPEGYYISGYDMQNDPILHDKDGNLCCNKCFHKTSETYRGGLCSKCRDAKMKIMKPILLAKPAPVQMPLQKIMLPQQPMKNGDVRKLPTANSPLWTVQWSVMGTAKLPYVVSRNPGHANGATTSEGWACSCPNFIQHTPRTECKHILKVMQLENVKPASPPVASLPEDQQEAFRKFLLQQAERGTPARPAGKTKPLITQGRRFR